MSVLDTLEFLMLSQQHVLIIFRESEKYESLTYVCLNILRAWRLGLSPVYTTTISRSVCVLHKLHRHCKTMVMFGITINKQDILHQHVPTSHPSDGAAARWARGTLRAPRVWIKMGRSQACRCTHCGNFGWAGSSASPLHSYGDTPAPGSALSLSVHSHRKEHQESSRPQRTLSGIQRAAKEESVTGYF